MTTEQANQLKYIYDNIDSIVGDILSNISYSTDTTKLDPEKVYIFSASTCAYGYGTSILSRSTDGTISNEYNYTGKAVTGNYYYHNRIGVLSGATQITFSSTPNAMWLYKVVYEIR